jgi:hypothetical protein
LIDADLAGTPVPIDPALAGKRSGDHRPRRGEVPRRRLTARPRRSRTTARSSPARGSAFRAG